jgi:hypothetical protein
MTQVSTNKPERARSREPRDEREPGVGTVLPWEQGRLFAQLFSAKGDDTSGFSSGLAQPAAHGDRALLEMFSEHLVPRLNAANQWPLHATLYLPRLGRINVSARREHGAWDIELEAEEERTSLWLAGVRQNCQDRLARALGQPVSLGLACAGSS